ncbi:MAG: potassium transporter TrkG [Lachnospiraceae bacterium]|nr:Trk family potassium uptake protein [Robinsoniella sp.]MDY3766400.1 potassium transporter TrkG [Lachnospiraceae bacterium]
MENRKFNEEKKQKFQTIYATIKEKAGQLSAGQIIGLGFLVIILIGTLLLMTPVASRDGNWTGFLDALFTATSATCVTGLVVVDTYTHWSIAGQVLILILIQIGGLGFMSLGMMLISGIRKNVGLKGKSVLVESINGFQIGGIIKFVKKMVLGTFLVEGIGAVILSIRFSFDMNIGEAIYNGIFHSISAFCNAGFDLMGKYEPYSSLVRYSSDWIVNITVILLVIIGGIGFIVWEDVLKNRHHFQKYRLHTKIVLVTTAVLTIGGAILFGIFEYHNLGEGMGIGERILTSLFDAVTPRTAGFNTTDIGQQTNSSKLLSVIFMFIGGSPGSTAGGIKTTTFVVFLFYMRGIFLKTRGSSVFRRRLSDEALKKASALACTNLTLALTATLVICGVQNIELADVLLETFSAISTVGMSAGITRDLVPVCRVTLIILMYCGRVGSLSFLLSFTDKKKISPIQFPEERILIG